MRTRPFLAWEGACAWVSARSPFPRAETPERPHAMHLLQKKQGDPFLYRGLNMSRARQWMEPSAAYGHGARRPECDKPQGGKMSKVSPQKIDRQRPMVRTTAAASRARITLPHSSREHRTTSPYCLARITVHVQAAYAATHECCAWVESLQHTDEGSGSWSNLA